MMTTTHTAGPWDWHGPYMTGAYKVSALHPEGGQSLDVMIDRSENNLANARLISAAPDLLAALQAVADYWAGGDVPEEIDAAMRAAIAKATS